MLSNNDDIEKVLSELRNKINNLVNENVALKFKVSDLEIENHGLKDELDAYHKLEDGDTTDTEDIYDDEDEIEDIDDIENGIEDDWYDEDDDYIFGEPDNDDYDYTADDRNFDAANGR